MQLHNYCIYYVLCSASQHKSENYVLCSTSMRSGCTRTHTVQHSLIFISLLTSVLYYAYYIHEHVRTLHAGGTAKGNYVYFSPHFNGISEGTVVRLDMRDLAKLAVAGGPQPIANDGLQALDLNFNTTRNSGFSGMFHDLDSSCPS
jgi:hypothetical protein